jgi:hypothetical protein
MGKKMSRRWHGLVNGHAALAGLVMTVAMVIGSIMLWNYPQQPQQKDVVGDCSLQWQFPFWDCHPRHPSSPPVAASAASSPTADPKPPPSTDSKPEPRSAPDAAPEAAPDTALKPGPKPALAAEPKPAPSTDLRTEPKPVPNGGQKPVPNGGQKPAPKSNDRNSALALRQSGGHNVRLQMLENLIDARSKIEAQRTYILGMCQKRGALTDDDVISIEIKAICDEIEKSVEGDK